MLNGKPVPLEQHWTTMNDDARANASVNSRSAELWALDQSTYFDTYGKLSKYHD